jgi:hypothetical protein
MNRCKRYQKSLVLFLYKELDQLEKAEVAAHLQICSRCQAELAELRQLKAAIPEQPLSSPDEQTLKALRNALSHQVRRQARRTAGRRYWPFTFIQPVPAFQFGFVALLLALGFLIGRQTYPKVATHETDIQDLLAASRQIQAANSAIDPYLAGVEKLKYDPATGQVEIYYNTVNDVRLRGDMADPAVRQVLRHAMLEETSPALRLHAIKAINAMAVKEQSLDPELIDAVQQVLEKEENQGVRLIALKILKSLPMSAVIKNMLVKVLLYDPNAALRIEAFEGLTGHKVSQEDVNHYLEAARQDTSSLIRYRANQFLEKLETSKTEKPKPLELSREG